MKSKAKMTTSLSSLHRKNTENIVRSVLSDLKKSLKLSISELEEEITSSGDVIINRQMWQRVNGLKIAIERIERYEKEVIDLMYPK